MPRGYQVQSNEQVFKVTPRTFSMHRLLGVGMVVSLLISGCSTVSLKQNAPIDEQSGNRGSQSASATSGGSGKGNADGKTYTVKKGDTLRSIANTQNIDWRELARINGMSEPYSIKIGQVLKVSDGPVSNTSSNTGSGVEVLPLTGADTPSKPSPSNTAVTSAPDANAIKWAWPYSGELIETYGDRNKGVDIGGKIGDPIFAAADGVVRYSGNNLKGYGNLIIIRHDAVYTSVYAHNSKLLVKENDVVKQGQKIAELGQADASTPRVHFEIRKGGIPVDPRGYLPKR